jgi:transcription-repair coupling factor (superfamily II helicase)
MESLLNLVQKNKKFQVLLKELPKAKDLKIGGLWGSSAAYLLSALSERAPSWILLVTSSIEEAEEAREDINLFRPNTALIFRPWEGFSTEEWRPSRQLPPEHLQILSPLLFWRTEVRSVVRLRRTHPTSSFVRYGDSALGGLHKQKGLPVPPKADRAGVPHPTQKIIVCPIQSLLQKLPQPKTLLESTLKVTVGEELGPKKILEWLVLRGFQKVSRVEAPGEYSLRGGIIDIFPPSSDLPYRIEFFGDTIESIRVFNTDTQTSVRGLKEVNILALRESTSGRLEEGSLLDYLPKDAWIALREPDTIEDRAKKMPGPLPWTHPYNEIEKNWDRHTKLSLSFLPFECEGAYNFQVESVERFGPEPSRALEELKRLSASGGLAKRTIVFCNNEAEEMRFQELLKDAGLRLESAIGRLNCGFFFKDLDIFLLSHHELFHRYRIRREPKKPVPSRPIESLLELKRGDYVVHVTHGIAQFLGIEALEQDGKKRECLLLEFEGGTRLYVPAARIELVQKYIGPKEHRPPLSRLGGQAWTRKLQEVERAVTDLAGELLEMQALRNAKPGIRYPQDTQWQKEFEAEFPYEETEDQLKVNQEIKKDMEYPRPMDRLVCGDVGYGKTELAIRAAFKAVMNGKQVSVLVPTTILAQQHYRTFSERMADYPIRIESLSRFKSPAEQKTILEALMQGTVDIVIGTHRLVQRDVEFKDLGLVIIDEEQRFGVEHKERLKKLRQTVDILTLTATPIPRTLHMALLGLRDISSLNTPPQDRQAIRTFLMRYDPEKVRQAILFELNREGQVYFVHNRVYNIEEVAENLTRLLPEAGIAVAHGQMPEKLLEERMLAFIDKKYDVLVSTTIIESGMDIPNVNTIFINEADSFGLAELHQLRGRVGRYKHIAYAYLLLPTKRPISPEAEKRLKAVEEFSHLGSGFKIALRDLEIRGAGNILGPEQHGHIAALGYEMYCQLMETAVKRVKREPLPLTLDVSINLNLDSYIPTDYVPEETLRMEIYRKLSHCHSREEIRAVEEELRDRLGPLPQPVKNLLIERELRLAAQGFSIRSMLRIDGRVVLEVEDLKKAETCLYDLRRRIRVINDNTLHLQLPKKDASPEEMVHFLKKVFKL